MAKGQVEGMPIVCKLTRPEPQPFSLALTHGETIFLCLYHARTSYQATGDHHRASRNDSKQLILSCLPYLALLFPRNPNNGCGLNVLLSSLLPSASWPIRCLPLWPCVTYNEPLSRTWVYRHPLVSTEGWFQDPPRLPESKDVLYKMVLPICGESASTDSTKHSLVPLRLVESADSELAFQKSDWIISFVSLQASPVSPTPPLTSSWPSYEHTV